MKQILFFISLFFLSITKISALMPKNEIRAVWLTTNYALDWPTKPFTTLEDIDKQKEELVNILCCLKKTNFNIVFFQTRLRGNVVYDSKVEPLSPFIRNKGYKVTYDPLAFAIEECHKLGLECHAWFVTYLLGAAEVKGEDNCSLVVKCNQLQTRIYKGEIYLDPGDLETDRYLLSIVEEIVDKYDVDGIHMDYIRYPEKPTEFPDDITYKYYGKGKNKTEWRKDNINRFVSRLYDMVKGKKPWVQVSSAVVGIYTRKLGDNKKYWTANEVCQDPEQWLRMGKHDFIVPMMYYSGNLFFPFVQDWQARSYGRFVVPGIGIYRMDEKDSNWDVQTVTEQIKSSRQHNTGGNAFFRANYLIGNKKGIRDEIKNNFYVYPALLPPLTWLKRTIPASPKHLQLTTLNDSVSLSWESVECFEKENMFYNVYYSKSKYIDIYDVSNLVATRVSSNTLSIPIDTSQIDGCYYAVTSYDRYHNESEISEPVYFKANFEN
ncbi:MAG: family 10 glycosylhydrolase [Candidatus Azobacteroides pseudotrichonymphae]|jgi:uncharacterized lipoprotein YddW (UPF0748 family)|nr:MAG: family 10 glycosylhydrolase [Candidatus Azobacteroides pseudotrichonymphae]